MGEGFTCYSDEVAVFNQAGLVEPLELPIAIKQGSWEALSSSWPCIKRLPIWERPDGRKLKYIALPELLPAETITSQSFIFPSYDSNLQEPFLKKLPPELAFYNLIKAGYQLKSGLNEEKIKQLIDLVLKTPAYSLTYSNFGQAWRVLKSQFSHIG